VVPPASHGIPLSPWYSRISPESPPLRLRDARPLWSSLPGTVRLQWGLLPPWTVLRQPCKTVLPPELIGRRPTQNSGFGLLPVRSPLLGESSLFLGVLRCFSSPSARARSYVFAPPRRGVTRARLPHSETLGSARSTAPRGVSSPCHVLRRPPPPRHPPGAFCSLTCMLARPQATAHSLIQHARTCTGPARPAHMPAAHAPRRGPAHRTLPLVMPPPPQQKTGPPFGGTGSPAPRTNGPLSPVLLEVCQGVSFVALNQGRVSQCSTPLTPCQIAVALAGITENRCTEMEPRRFELPTSAVQRRRSPN
jgi:hypothetical protein